MDRRRGCILPATDRPPRMAEVGVLAYPVLLAAMYGVYRVGREERWGIFEWMRLATLALLMGLVVAIQVKLAMLGFVRDPLTIAASLLSIAGMATLIGLYIWGQWQARTAAGPGAWD